MRPYITFLPVLLPLSIAMERGPGEGSPPRILDKPHHGCDEYASDEAGIPGPHSIPQKE
jgi:hypothetical protein